MNALANVGVPLSMLGDAPRFGGVRKGDLLTGDLVIRRGRAMSLAPAAGRVDRLVLPRFTDPHLHLDKCHTAHRLPQIGGDLDAAIAAQCADRRLWTAEDIRARATRGLDELARAGCGAVRSHVDWGTSDDPAAAPLAWDILANLDPGPITLQRAALTSIPVMADGPTADRIAVRVARDGGVLGAFVNGQPERAEGIANLFRAADRHGLMLDFHADEGLRADLDGVEMIADVALATRFGGKVLIGHACALMNRSGDDLQRIAGKLARAGIAVAALPSTNLYLQGRTSGTPDRRGLTRLHELRTAGVTVVLGADNVRDAFCPLGSHDPMATLALASLAAHLDPPYGQWLPMISTDARRAVGLPPLTVDGARVQDLICFDAASLDEAIAGRLSALPLDNLAECAA